MNTIRYDFFAKAVRLYETQGYKPIEVPWRVTADVLNITKPPTATGKDYIIQGTDKGLLASGEQGFLYLANKGVLPAGKYQTITPCFRNESHDRYHSKQFMKLELIELLDPAAARELETSKLMHMEVSAMAELAKKVFNELAADVTPDFRFDYPTCNDAIAVPGTKSVDVVLNFGDKSMGNDGYGQVELGSYGARKTSFCTWIYGTGLAEPRFSRALQEFRSKV